MITHSIYSTLHSLGGVQVSLVYICCSVINIKLTCARSGYAGSLKSKILTVGYFSSIYKVVFPLFGQLDMPVSKGDNIPSEVDYTIW